MDLVLNCIHTFTSNQKIHVQFSVATTRHTWVSLQKLKDLDHVGDGTQEN